jgi:hypothetical protein
MMNQTKFLKGECSVCKGHIEFPAETAGTTINCPHCGKPTELLLAAPPDEPTVPRRTIVWTAIGILVLGTGLALAFVALKRAESWAASRKSGPAASSQSSAATNAASADASPQAGPAGEAGFEATSVSLEKTPGSSLVYATGTISNPSSRQRFGVKVELDLLDGTGKKVGSAKDYTQIIEPGAKWQYKALVVGKSVSSAKLSSIQEQK